MLKESTRLIVLRLGGGAVGATLGDTRPAELLCAAALASAIRSATRGATWAAGDRWDDCAR